MFALPFVLGLAFLCSCRQSTKLTGPDRKYDLIEAELRTRERELLQARQELAQARQLADVYQPHPGLPSTGPIIDPRSALPLAHGTYSGGPGIREVLLGNGTGGRDDDGIPGDEALQVVLVPKDEDGTAVKVPIRATVFAFEIAREGQKLPIGQWEVTSEQLRKTWKSGLFGSGYFVPLAWDRAPASDKIRVAVRVATQDGREFEADRDVRVTPLVGAFSPTPTPAPYWPATPEKELPPPSVVDRPQSSRPLTPPTVLPPTQPDPSAARLLPAAPR